MRPFQKTMLFIVLASLVFLTRPARSSEQPGSVDLGHSALVLIEYQRDWFDEDGKIHHLMKDKKLFENSVQHSKVALEAARRAGMTIVHVGLAFAPGYPELGRTARFGLRKAIPAVGSFPEGGKGSQFVPPFTPQSGEFVVSGRTGASAFAGSNLESFLRNNGITDLYLMGYATHVCLESTFRQAHDLGYAASVILDATAAFTQTQQDYFRDNVVHHYGHALTTPEFVSQLGTSGQ